MTNLPASASVDAAAGSAAAPASFNELPLSPAMLANLQQLGYLAMTPIQAASLPLALAGQDLIAQAKTGSGKTASFTLPILSKLDPALFDVQGLVLCPTRELAEQVTQEIRRLARAIDNIKILTLCGGAAMRPQMNSLEHGAHIIVGTPGRIMDHLERGSLKLEALNTLVLDEADRMLDMGFFDDIAYVARACPRKRQTLLFSATYPEGIAKLSQRFLREPQEVKLTEQHEATKIRQRFYEVSNDQRMEAVAMLLNHFRPASTIAFCNTRQQCRDLLDYLTRQGFQAMTLHGELDQRERDQVMVQFANRSCSVLVATDVAARGLDIAQLEAVINVEVAFEPEVHIHRIGRTGRVDEDGWAFSLVSGNEMERLGNIEKLHGFSAEWHPLKELTNKGGVLHAPMVTLHILGGRKEKIRAGDILGALTKDGGFAGEQIGKINVNELSTYIAVERGIAQQVLRKLNEMTVKGKKVKAFALGSEGAKPAKPKASKPAREEPAARADKPVWTRKPPEPVAKPERQGRAKKLAPRGRGR